MAEISEKSFPFDSVETAAGEYDRSYLAEDFARFFSTFISSGVFMKESTNLQVIANGDMTVSLMPGSAIIDGYRYDNIDTITIPIDPADGIQDRIDRIAITWSKGDRDIHYTLRSGEKSYNPVAPELRRTEEYKDYVVADIYIAAGTVSVIQANITDTRLSNELCGLATPFDEIDTTTIFNQFESWFKQIEAAGNTEVETMLAEYNAWLGRLESEQMQQCADLLEEMRNLLDDSAAGKLQLEIDDLKEYSEQNIEKIYTMIDFDNFAMRGSTTVFNEDGSIKTTDKTTGEYKITVFNADGSITDTLCDAAGAELAVKTTVFNADGSIDSTVETASSAI